MKKFLIISLIAVAFFTSCYNRIIFVPSLDDYNEDETPSTICVPVFKNGDTSSQAYVPSTTGIIDMTPEGSPFGDYSEATSVMVTMPIMVGLDTVDNRDGNALFRLDTNVYAFGFPLRFDRENSRVNNDGAFIRYDIMSEHEGWEDVVVGRIDYYYNAKNQTFSYRQVVALTIDPSDFGKAMGYEVPTPIYQTLVLVIQYDDVAIEGVDHNGMVSFNTVEFDRNGEIVPKVIIDQIRFGNLSFFSSNAGGVDKKELLYDEDVFGMDRYNAINRSSDGKYVSMNLPYTTELLVTENVADYPENMRTLIESVAGTNLRIDNDEEAKAFDMEFALKLLEELYGNPYKHDTYNSYGNFRSDRIQNVKGLSLTPASGLVRQPESQYNIGAMDPYPTIYDYENNVIASSQRIINGGFGGFYIYANEGYEASNFGKFFGNLNFEFSNTRMNSIRILIKDFLNLLGIDDETYIENFYRMVKQSARRSDNSQYIWYTGESVSSDVDPDEYESTLIEAYKTLDPGSVQFEETLP